MLVFLVLLASYDVANACPSSAPENSKVVPHIVIAGLDHPIEFGASVQDNMIECIWKTAEWRDSPDEFLLTAVPLNNTQFADKVAKWYDSSARSGKLENLVYDTSYKIILEVLYPDGTEASISAGIHETRKLSMFMVFLSTHHYYYIKFYQPPISINLDIPSPMDFMANVTSKEFIYLTWNHPKQFEGTAYNYFLSISEKGGSDTVEVPATETSYKFTNLKPNTSYTFILRLVTHFPPHPALYFGEIAGPISVKTE